MWESNGYISSNKKPVKNKDIIQDIIKLKTKCLSAGIPIISFKHIRSHQPEPKDHNTREYMFWKGNDIVDKCINKCINNYLSIN
jgi:ribonuclease HI